MKLGYNELVNIYDGKRKVTQAMESFNHAIALDNENAGAYHDLGCLYLQWGKVPEAIEALRKAIALLPNYATAYNNLALAFESAGNAAQAIMCLKKALDIKPDLAEAWNNLGNQYKNLKDFSNAQQYYQKALAIDPVMPAALNNLGLLLQDMGKYEEAITFFEMAVRTLPPLLDSFINLGNVYQCVGKLRKAKSSYQNALKIKDDHPVTFFNLGVVCNSIGEPKEAEVVFKKALELKPDYEIACASLVKLLIQHCAWDELEPLNPKLDDFTSTCLRLGRRPAETPFQSLIRHCDPELNQKVARYWSSEAASSIQHITLSHHAREKKADRKLRIGYISNNFRNHPSADLISGIIAQHNRKRFEIVCYHYGINDGSRQRKRIEQSCECFVELNAVDDQAAAERIYNDRTDILVDLVGHTEGSRIAICAFRPAPLQLRYLGFAGTCGADFYDYLIGDEIVTPADEACCFSEELILMPSSYHVNNYAIDYAEDSPSHMDSDSRREKFIFCCFNTTYKIDQHTFRCWMEILQSVPSAVLWLLSESGFANANLSKYVQKSGIAQERVQIFGKVNKYEHFKRLHQTDLFLDTFPVSGGASVADALWAGIPVLTLKGKHFASRMSDSILTASGLGDLVCNSESEFIDKAIELATIANRLPHLKKRVYNARKNSPIFNPQLFARHLEAAYEHIWQLNQAGRTPELIHVANLDIPT